MGFELKPSTKLNDILDNCKVLRSQYEELLTPFFNASAIKCWKAMIYSLDIAYWKLDKLWEYLNDDINLVDFVTSVKKNK